MHIPDGFLSPAIALLFWVVSIIVVSLSLRRAGREADLKKLPLFAGLAAFIFAAQMLNFPVLGGTSGHLIGGALLALMLGFDPAVIIMSTVLVVQALVFHDGGIFALGANIFNMALVAPFIGAAAGKYFGGLKAAFLASITSVVAAAAAASLQLWASGAVQLFEVLAAMVFVHLFIGIGEGIISTIAYAYFNNALPLPEFSARRLAALSVMLAVFFAPFASSLPDGLEATAAKLEFDSLAANSMTPLTVMADYLFPAIENEALATALAGLFGTALVFAAAAAVFCACGKLAK